MTLVTLDAIPLHICKGVFHFPIADDLFAVRHDRMSRSRTIRAFVICYNEALAAHLMNMASPEIQKLAGRLLAFEAAQGVASNGHADVAVRVIDALRVQLVRLAGVHGFQSLLSRALTLAKAEIPALHIVQTRDDGSLKGFDKIEQSEEAGTAEQAGTVLITHLLGLLITFIGEPLTLRLVQNTWPDNSTGQADLNTEEKL